MLLIIHFILTSWSGASCYGATEKSSVKDYSYLVIDTTLPSYNPKYKDYPKYGGNIVKNHEH